MKNPKNRFCELGRAVIETELSALAPLIDKVDANFSTACETVMACQGRVIVTGIGKSGHIGRKISATFASTGTPSFFMHPSEASHGDMGMITPQDVVLALSNSGETDEILSLLPFLKQFGIPLISILGNAVSTLARESQTFIAIGPMKEACPLGLAPTSTTTAMLVMGDALAISLLEAKGFTREDFAVFHPGGHIGRRLLLRVSELMHQQVELPRVSPNTTIGKTLEEMSAKKLGFTTVVDAQGKLVGVYTDGDVRRTMQAHHSLETPVSTVMSTRPKVIQPHMLAAEAFHLMQENHITALVVVDEAHQPIGVVHLHDLLAAGIR